MKRLLLILTIASVALCQTVHAQYYSVNYDTRTVAAMVAAFGTEAVAEGYYREQVDDILKHYTAAEVATAGIFAAKFLEHKALSDLGIWNSRTENYYYRRIYRMVAEKIMPKIWVVAKQMLHSPQTAIYWGSYLMKVCDDTKSLCMQFESVVTNSTLTFSDIAFLEINPEIAPLLKLSETGNIDWQRMMDNFARIPGNFTHENLKSDLDNLYNTGVGLATAGIANLGDALLQSSSFHDLLGGKVEEIGNLYEHYGSLFEQAEHDISGLLIDMVGGPDNVAGLFNFSNYNLTAWMTDYLDEAMGNYYTQRWYIARRDQGSVSLCDYYPPTDDNSILNGGAWVRFNTSDPNFYPNASQREQVLANSEGYAGWSRNRVQQLNNQNDGFSYSINYWMSAYIISKKNKQTKKAYAYEIHVSKSWNKEEVVYEEKKMEEMEVTFLMDRFGYMRTIDKSAYERNKEAANAENKYVFNCMNTDKICIFTDNGKMHSIKVADIPLVRFRDKGTPADNLSNYDSAQERMLYVAPLASVKENTLLFVTAASMCKLVSGAEFDVAKRTIVSTKLAEEDSLIFVGSADEMEQVVFQSEGGYFLRFQKQDISAMKKTSIGVRGMKLAEGDKLDHAYLLESRQEYTITYHDKPYVLNRIKLSKRDSKGIKPRI